MEAAPDIDAQLESDAAETKQLLVLPSVMIDESLTARIDLPLASSDEDLVSDEEDLPTSEYEDGCSARITDHELAAIAALSEALPVQRTHPLSDEWVQEVDDGDELDTFELTDDSPDEETMDLSLESDDDK